MHSSGMSPTAWVIVGVSVSLGSLVFSIALSAAVIARLPVDYFSGAGPRRPPGTPLAPLILKNIAGWILVLLGVALSVPGVPGQGLLTILAGLILVDFPGKYRLERALARRPLVRSAIAALRARSGRPPFTFPD